MTDDEVGAELRAALEALIVEANANPSGRGRAMTEAERDALLWVTDREGVRPDPVLNYPSVSLAVRTRLH
jgi:hypothetical protein